MIGTFSDSIHKQMNGVMKSHQSVHVDEFAVLNGFLFAVDGQTVISYLNLVEKYIRICVFSK